MKDRELDALIKGYDKGMKKASEQIAELFSKYTITEINNLLKVSAEADFELSSCIRFCQNTIFECQNSEDCGIFDEYIDENGETKKSKVTSMYIDDDCFYVRRATDDNGGIYTGMKNVDVDDEVINFVDDRFEQEHYIHFIDKRKL